MIKIRKLISKLFDFVFVVIESVCKNFFKILFKRYILSFFSILLFTFFIDFYFINDILFSNDNINENMSNDQTEKPEKPEKAEEHEFKIYAFKETPEEKRIREEELRRTLRHIYIQLERLGIYQDSRQNNEFHK
jgi:hypothetical protein